MRKSDFGIGIFLRPIIMLLPLMMGSPFLSYCLCSYNNVMTFISGGPAVGFVTCAYTALAAAAVGAWMNMGSAASLFLAAQISAVSLICTLCVVKRKSFYTGMLACSCAYGIANVLELKSGADAAGLSIAENVWKIFPTLGDIQSTLPSTSGADMEYIAKLLEYTEKYVKLSIPGIIAVGAAVGGYGVMWLVSASVRKTVLDNGHSFSDIRLGKGTLIFGAAGAAMLFVPVEEIQALGLNALIIFLFVCFCAGISLTEYFLRKKVKALFARIVIHGAVLLAGSLIGAMIPFLNVIFVYILLGIMDSFVSIRKRVDAGYEKK